MSLGAPSPFVVDLHSLVGGVESHTAGSGLGEPKGEDKQKEPTVPSKPPLADVCSLQRCLLLLGMFGMLVGTSLAVWFVGRQPLKPLPLQESLPLQDAEATLTRCREEAEGQGAPFGQLRGKKVSFRTNRGNFLLEVQVGNRPNWLLVCHESWDLSLGNWICRRLGHICLAHHKGVNLTDVKLNGTQEFAQVLPDWKGGIKDMWQIRKQCPSGRIVALKCSECGSHSKAPQVTAGKDTAVGLWPWQVSLSLNARHVCTGSLLSPEWVATAARCVHNARPLQLSNWVAVAGAKAQTGAAVEKVLPHPNYDGRSHDYDIAVLKLKEPLNLSDTVQAVCLPRYHQDIAHRNTCWLSAQAHSAKMPATSISSQPCNASCGYAGALTPRMLCASHLDGGTKACQGDYGGSLVCQHEGSWHLAGIGSSCAEPRQPGIYTKVAEFLDWIYQVMESN